VCDARGRLAVRCAAQSDIGLRREGNEDSAYAGVWLLAVADGMGGHAGGEVASAAVIEALRPLDTEVPADELLDVLEAAVRRAGRTLREMVANDPSLLGMGTTLTALLRSGSQLGLVHIGDSRAYLVRDGEVVQLTHDQTLVQSLLDEGQITAGEVASHPQRSLLLQALGAGNFVPDLQLREARLGDRYLLCSDGLHQVADAGAVAQVLLTVADPDQAAKDLIALAIAGGGPDNITCIVADVVDSGTTRLPATKTPVLAGAAASTGDPRLPPGGTGPFDVIDDHFDNHFSEHGAAPLTAPTVLGADGLDLGSMPPASENGTGPNAVPRGSHRAKPKRAARTSRRRWPIVTTSLVVLLAVIIGGGYIAWRWSQDQYYVGADSKGEVVIYRGVNQRIAGLNLSKPYRQTGIMLDQVPLPDQQTLRSTDAASSLSNAQAIVLTVSQGVHTCKAQYAALQSWVTQENNYQAAVALARKNHKPANKIPKPGPPPPKAGPTCPAAPAFGIAASAVLVPPNAGHS
jgi:protein phosphatase